MGSPAPPMPPISKLPPSIMSAMATSGQASPDGASSENPMDSVKQTVEKLAQATQEAGTVIKATIPSAFPLIEKIIEIGKQLDQMIAQAAKQSKQSPSQAEPPPPNPAEAQPAGSGVS